MKGKKKVLKETQQIKKDKKSEKITHAHRAHKEKEKSQASGCHCCRFRILKLCPNFACAMKRQLKMYKE